MAAQIRLGPKMLGRGLVIPAGVEIPEACRDFPRERLDESVLKDPKALVDRLHEHWLKRKPITVVVDLPPDALQKRIAAAEVETREPYELGPEFNFVYERLRFLLTANNLNGYPGPNQFELTHVNHAMKRFNPPDQAVRDGKAKYRILRSPNDTEDIWTRYPEGSEPVRLWVDGGPRQFFNPEDLGGAGVLHAESIEAGSLKALAGFRPAKVPLLPSGRALADDQMAAVLHGSGPCRVSAPAGSGKTSALTSRVRFMVDSGIENLVAVAFNTGAADEMTARTKDLGKQHIRTLNALGWAILLGSNLPNNQPGFLPTAFASRGRRGNKLLQGGAINDLVKELLQEHTIPLRPGKVDDQINSYIEAFRDIRLAFMQPKDAGQKHDIEGVEEIFPAYCAKMLEMGVTDFDGQIYDALRLMLRNPQVRRHAQYLTTHALLDEAQDAHPAAIMMMSLLTAPRYSAFIVGDPDQNIYSFMGSNVKYMLEPNAYFPGMSDSTYFLEYNYRCPKEIVDAENLLLSRNIDRLSAGDIKAAPGKTANAEDLLTITGDDADMYGVLGFVQNWLDQGASPSEIGIFARGNSNLLPMQVVLRDNKIPCDGPLKPGILNQAGCKPALAWLAIATEPNKISTIALNSARFGSNYKISNTEWDKLTNDGKLMQTSLMELAQRAPFTGPVYDFIQDLIKVATFASNGQWSTSELLNEIIRTSGLQERIENHDKDATDPSTEMQLPALKSLRQVAVYRPNPKGFEAWLRELLSESSDEKGVKVSTVHKVKGQEYDYTIVWGADEKTFPDVRESTPEGIEGERRLFYVATTRAKKQCVVMAGAPIGPDEDPPMPSRFVAELSTPLTLDEKAALKDRKRGPEVDLVPLPEAKTAHEVHHRRKPLEMLRTALGFDMT